MKRISVLAVSALAAGALLWAGAGEARAEECYGDRVVIRHYEPHRNTLRFSYGYGPSWGHRRGCGWGYHRGYSYGPVVRYTQVVVPDTVVVNIHNSNGSYTPVTLRRQGNVYVGPRGEQYLSVPTEDQLKAVYGLK